MQQIKDKEKLKGRHTRCAAEFEVMLDSMELDEERRQKMSNRLSYYCPFRRDNKK